MRIAPKRLLRSIGITVGAVAICGGVVHSATWDANLPAHDVTDLAVAWDLATNGGTPLATTFVDDARKELEKIAGTGTATLISKDVFPVVTFDALKSAELHRRAIGLQLFVTSVSRYRSSGGANLGNASGDGELLKQLPWKVRVAHLELLVVEASLFLESESKAEKCVHWTRMKEHAVSLGWKSATITGALDGVSATNIPEIPPGWRGFESSAKALYDLCASSQDALRQVCSLVASVSGSDLETVVKNALEQRIQERFYSLATEVGSALESPTSELSSLERASAVSVPTKDIFALSKTVQDAATLVAYVSNDDSGLEKGQSPWLAQAKAAEARAAAETKTWVGGEADRVASSNELSKAVAELRQITAQLGEIAKVAGMPSDVAVCRALNINVVPTPAENDALVRSIDDCLGAIGRAYTKLKTQAERDPNAPAFREFGSKVSGLSQTIAAVSRL